MYIYIFMVVYYTHWQLLRSSSSTYFLVFRTSSDNFRRSISSSHGSLLLSFNCVLHSHLSSSFPFFSYFSNYSFSVMTSSAQTSSENDASTSDDIAKGHSGWGLEPLSLPARRNLCGPPAIVDLNNSLRDIHEGHWWALADSCRSYILDYARGMSTLYFSSTVNPEDVMYTTVENASSTRYLEDRYSMTMIHGRHRCRPVKLLRGKDSAE